MSTNKTTRRRGFTLVELLVVIGIIALLIAILMPALSRARKQALQVSCGSNERQVVLAMLSYANDWKEQLPSGFSNIGAGRTPLYWSRGHLYIWARLPIIGFDTTTDVYAFQNLLTLTGWFNNDSPALTWGPIGQGYLTRDYLKNDFDVVFCPDGWFTRGSQILRDGGSWPNLPACCNRGPIYMNGYLYLAGRPARPEGWGAACGLKDRAQDIAKTASDKPDLLLLVDFNNLSEWGNCGGSPSVPPFRANIAANHWPTTLVNDFFNPPPCVDQYDYERQPLGSNEVRIDARVTWKPWQEQVPRYLLSGDGNAYCNNDTFYW